MRHAALTMARQVQQQAEAPLQTPDQMDLVFASDMLDLPSWKGFVGLPWAQLPTVLYFHENQWTYPLSPGQPLDLHYGYTNFLSAAVADAVWFNSNYHRQTFLAAAHARLSQMPDCTHVEELAEIEARSHVVYPGITPRIPPHSRTRQSLDASPNGPKSGDFGYGRFDGNATPLTIGWVSRWEHDKRPEVFAEAIERLCAEQRDFRLILLGESFRKVPECYQRLLDVAGDRVLHSGYAESREAYWQHLDQMDVVVSSASHEFFGIAIAEAATAGVVPIVPHDLAYPELYDGEPPAAIFYDGQEAELVTALRRCIDDPASLADLRTEAQRRAARLNWTQQTQVFDDQCEAVVAWAPGP
ncbi:Glycosyl transferases group 1 [Roseimaritima ulvae]|uniref:tRNA-queuosine alpha-mannosyltransferase n=2 Tax=Roseimaritima ulvae TaxID=980254 RepID=A0A5B9QX52_9BACT|nr:Glycosyl transferases group 1 [Roseimaritima ulvae]